MAFLARTLLSHPILLQTPISSINSIATGTLRQLRCFSLTTPLNLNAHPDTKKTPPYPHGFSQWYKQSNRGLYGHVRLRTHARVAGKFPAQRTIKRWRPNVHRKRLWSASLGRMIRVKLVIRVLRTIDKVGGIDNYLLGQSPGRLRELGPTGWALRWRILRTERGKAVWEAERQRLGLQGLGPRDEGWIDPVEEEQARVKLLGLEAAEADGAEDDWIEMVEDEGEVMDGGEAEATTSRPEIGDLRLRQ